MQTVALHTRLKAGCEAEYERVHEVIPPELDTALRDHPVNVAWQAVVGPLHDTPDDYSGEDDGIRHVWSLPAEGPARST